MSQYCPGMILNERFLLIQNLGGGAFGAVHQAYDLEKSRIVAVKLIPVRIDHATLVNEFLKTRALDHPGIAKTYEFSARKGTPGTDLFVCEHVQGRSFHEVTPELTWVDRLRVLQKVAEAMEYAHSQGILHLDLHPGNILVGMDLETRLIDFGLSAFSKEHPRHDSEVREGTNVLNVRFGDPVLAESGGLNPTPAADIYSFGITLWYTLHFEFPRYQMLLQDRDRSSLRSSRDWLEHLFLRCTDLRVENRYSSFTRIIEDLTTFKNVISKETAENENSHPLFGQEHYETLESFAEALDFRLQEVDPKRMNRVDGLFVPKEDRFAVDGGHALVTFDLDGKIYGVNGDSSIQAMLELLRLYKASLRYGLPEPDEIFAQARTADGRDCLRLRSNYDVGLSRYRANGFYCYSPPMEEIGD